MKTINRREGLAWMLALGSGWPAWSEAAEAPVELEGFKFDSTVSLGGKTLQLNGAAISNILSVRTTAVALYMEHRQTTPEAALAEPGPKRLCFYSLREVSAKDLSNSFLDRLRQNTAPEEINGNFLQIAQFGSAFGSRSKLSRGDFVAMDFTLAQGMTDMSLNGQHIGEPIKGEPFFRMLMKIWMGPKVRPATRKGLLGEITNTAA
jgi:hypothetical protein